MMDMLGIAGMVVFGFLILLIGGFAFYIGKKYGRPSISNFLDKTVETHEHFEDLLSLGKKVNKDLIYNFEKIGSVNRVSSFEFSISDSSEMNFKDFFDDNSSYNDYKEEYEDLDHLIFDVDFSDSSFFERFFKKKKNKNIFVIPEKFVFETVDGLTISTDVDIINMGDNVWMCPMLSSVALYQNISFVDFNKNQLDMLKETIKHIQHFNQTHAQKMEEIEKKSNRYENSWAGNVNKYDK